MNILFITFFVGFIVSEIQSVRIRLISPIVYVHMSIYIYIYKFR